MPSQISYKVWLFARKQVARLDHRKLSSTVFVSCRFVAVTLLVQVLHFCYILCRKLVPKWNTSIFPSFNTPSRCEKRQMFCKFHKIAKFRITILSFTAMTVDYYVVLFSTCWICLPLASWLSRGWRGRIGSNRSSLKIIEIMNLKQGHDLAFKCLQSILWKTHDEWDFIFVNSFKISK